MYYGHGSYPYVTIAAPEVGGRCGGEGREVGLRGLGIREGVWGSVGRMGVYHGHGSYPLCDHGGPLW